jgi:hypothetical protein
MTAEVDLPDVPSGYLRFGYMVGQDQAEKREQLRGDTHATLVRTHEAIARSRALLERMRPGSLNARRKG